MNVGKKKQITECSLCCMKVDNILFPNNSNTDDDGNCAICMENKPNSIVIPCGHTLCHTCAIKWFQSSDHCPFCRVPSIAYRTNVPYE